MKIFKIIIFFCLIILSSCNNNSLLVTGLKGVNESIKAQYAPDKRVAIYDIEIDSYNNKIVVTGEVNTKEGYQKLLDSLKSLDIDFINQIRVLPDSVIGNKMFAVANNSVINIRSKPSHSAELGTQGLLGMPLNVLDKKGDFFRVQTPDNYISWVDKGGVTLMNKGEFDLYNNYKKIIYTKNFGYVYSDKSENASVVSDITLGGILKYMAIENDFFKVLY